MHHEMSVEGKCNERREETAGMRNLTFGEHDEEGEA